MCPFILFVIKSFLLARSAQSRTASGIYDKRVPSFAALSLVVINSWDLVTLCALRLALCVY